MSNTAVQKITLSQALQKSKYLNLIKQALGDEKRAKHFQGSILSAVAVNPKLQECEPLSLITSALLGETLNLTPSPQLGQFYLLPFKNNKTGTTEAQFILGYKGLLQLATRSNNYKKINVVEVKQGEFIKCNPFAEEYIFEPLEDFENRANAETIGYYAKFEYLNGFTKELYFSKEQMLNHADTYSKAFSKTAYQSLQNGEIPSKDLWKFSSFWYKNFDEMAKKTMLRQLLMKWGVLSLEMQTAFENDNQVLVINENNDIVPNLEVIEEVAQETPAFEEVQEVNFDEL